ncbi:MAG: FkbM family methyltransferase [Bacteriovoracaceae bacterium]|nr:FkbM family methyltransferase [Bacteriovoracaceae bacterium]
MLKLLATIISDILIIVLRLNKGTKWSSYFLERIGDIYHTTIAHNQTPYKFLATNKLLYYRAITLFTKEPETIQWLEGQGENKVLFDVGANVGVYTIFAAKRGSKVFAFEPMSSNFYTLNKNIALNKLENNITAYPFAISNEHTLNTLRLSTFMTGAAHHNFGESKNFAGEDFIPEFTQGSISFSLDQLVYDYKLPTPHYLKIDVDGLESKIISGAQRLLKDPVLESILIEANLDSECDANAVELIKASGFSLKAKGQDEFGKGNRISNLIFDRS